MSALSTENIKEGNETNVCEATNILNENNINNNVINHPLSNIQIKKNETIDNFDDDMTEINLILDSGGTSASSNDTIKTEKNQNASPKKSKWVKFDEEINENKNAYSKEDLSKNINSNNNSLTDPPSSSQITESAQTSNKNTNISKKQLKSLQESTQVSSISSNVPPSVVAVLKTESVHVNIDGMNSSSVSPQSSNDQNNQPKNITISMPATRTVELSTGRIREGFANGDIIVNLLPTNTKWPWITPAVFRPELVPEELMAQGLTLTVEEYVAAIETLVNDYRFTIYNICYKRVLVCWITLAFCVLLVLLFSGLQGIALFSLGVAWLFLNAAAIFACMWMKLRLSRGLEKCLGRVNKQLLKHKILLVLDDRGRISCHKINLCFMYFDPAQCIAFLNEFIERQEQLGNNIQTGWERKLDVNVNDIVIQGSNPVRLSRKQAIAQEIFLTYLQRWGKDFLRRRLDWTCNEAGVHEQPRHLMSSVCPCQYEEEILHSKIKLEQDRTRCCCGLRNPFKHL